MKQGKKVFTWILVLLLILACLLPLVPTEIQGADIEINGSGSGGIPGASSNVSGSYNIWSTDKILGFRFTLAEENGMQVEEKDIYDVFSSVNLSSFVSGRPAVCCSADSSLYTREHLVRTTGTAVMIFRQEGYAMRYIPKFCLK